MGEYFFSSEISVYFNVCNPGIFLQMKSVWEVAYVLCQNQAAFRILWCKQFLDKMCGGIQKNCWLDDDHGK